MISQQQGAYFPTATPLAEGVGLSARVDRVEFAAALHAPSDRPFPFAYAITICNQSPRAVTIKARKWVVKNLASGTCHVTEGDGVVGRCPRLEPGQSFSYESYHIVASDSVADGAYLACDDAGRALMVRVPAFVMKVPAQELGRTES